MKIQSIHLISLRNEEHYQFQADFKALVGNYTAATLDIKTPFDKFLLQFNDEAEALDVIRKSAITEDLTIADMLRDATFRGLSDAVKAASKHFTPEVKKAAANLKPLFDHYGNIARKSFDEETAAITSLIADLQGTYASDTATAGIADWVKELQQNNLDFDTIKSKRYNEDATKTQLRMKEVRTAIDITYRSIVERINALMIVNGEANYLNFANELNKRIENYNLLIAQRQGRNAKNNGDIITEAV